MCNKFKVKHKKSGEVLEVYDITYAGINIPIPFFLVYINGKFKGMPADAFEPYVEMVKQPLNE